MNQKAYRETILVHRFNQRNDSKTGLQVFLLTIIDLSEVDYQNHMSIAHI